MWYIRHVQKRSLILANDRVTVKRAFCHTQPDQDTATQKPLVSVFPWPQYPFTPLYWLSRNSFLRFLDSFIDSVHILKNSFAHPTVWTTRRDPPYRCSFCLVSFAHYCEPPLISYITFLMASFCRTSGPVMVTKAVWTVRYHGEPAVSTLVLLSWGTHPAHVSGTCL